MAQRNRDGLWLLLLGGAGLVLVAGGTSSARASSRPPSRVPDNDPNEASDGPPVFETNDRVALARIIRSECGNQTLAERVAVAWCARNMARRRRDTAGSIAQLVCQPCGKSAGYRRPFSSRLPPRAEDLQLAGAVLGAPQAEDPTNGATNCFEPGPIDRTFAAGTGRESANDVRRRWTTDYRLERYGNVGAWELYGPRRNPTPKPPGAAPSAIA